MQYLRSYSNRFSTYRCSSSATFLFTAYNRVLRYIAIQNTTANITFVTSNTGGFDSFSNISRFLCFSSLALPVTGKYCLFLPVFLGTGSDGCVCIYAQTFMFIHKLLNSNLVSPYHNNLSA